MNEGEIKPMRKNVLLLIILTFLISVNQCSQIPSEKSEPVGIPTPKEFTFQNDAIRNSQYTFYENIGQIEDEGILYYGQTSTLNVGFSIGKILLWKEDSCDIVELLFEDAFHQTPIGSNQVGYDTNYFLGNRGNFNGVNGYREIHYKNLWKGIDAIFSYSQNGIEYDFAIDPFSNPSDIKLKVKTGEKTCIDDCVSLKRNLKAYQNEFPIHADCFLSTGGLYCFDIDGFDSSKEIELNALLVETEPVIFSTYMGASRDDRAGRIRVNSEGDLIVYLYTDSLSFPRAPQSFGEAAGEGDCILFKMSPNGESLLARIFFGGTGVEFPMGLAIDDNDDIYISGHTGSSDLYNNISSYNGGELDAFIAKIPSDMSDIHWLRYIGGNGTESGWCLDVDDAGNTYLTGETNSTDFPSTDSFDNFYNGFTDSFVLKLSADGTTIIYSTYLGGEDDDVGLYISIDSENCAYITGWTKSGGFPVFPESGCFDATYNDRTDCFITKVSPDGDELVFSTYIGDIGEDKGVACAIDESNNLYCAGITNSQNFPVTENPLFEYNGFGDGFVLKLSTTGDELLFSTFIGGYDVDVLYDMCLDSSGSVYITGYTESEDFPPKYELDTHQGEDDCFLTKLTSDGSSVCYSTLFGGSGNDYCLGVTVDSLNNAYVTGMTNSFDFPTHNARYASYAGGDWDCFISGFRDMGDADGDGLRDYQEAELGTNPYSNDTDADGIPDTWEIENNLDPEEDDANEDPDVDGLDNLNEYYHNTNPYLLDTDSDGYSDGWEVQFGFAPTNAEVSIAQVLVGNIPIIVLGVASVVVVIVVRLLLPKYKERQEKRRKEESDEERRKALEELMGKEPISDANIPE